MDILYERGSSDVVDAHAEGGYKKTRVTFGENRNLAKYLFVSAESMYKSQNQHDRQHNRQQKGDAKFKAL
jgi:hypothetical protein